MVYPIGVFGFLQLLSCPLYFLLCFTCCVPY